MTQRIKGFTVILENEIREDDVEFIVNAIHMIKGIQNVVPVESCSEDYIVAMNTKSKIREKFYEFMKENL